MQATSSTLCCLALQLLLLLLQTAATTVEPCPSSSWTLRGDSCYQWFNGAQYWLDAEHACVSSGGHLASIGSEQENRLVGRLAHCRDAWIGQFATDVTRLTDPLSYSWTDGSDTARFERHNFSHLDTIHQPLVRTDGEWWLNSLYHERHPFVCKLDANSTRGNSSSNGRCSDGWALFQDHCYLMPQFEANFNEANFYCQGRSAQLLSVLSESEQSYIGRFIFGIGSCASSLDQVWAGLIKLNPCFPDSGGRELCYQWTDFSGKHQGFPKWDPGHPNTADWTVNCATLSDGRLRSDSCHSRHRFVCKSPAANDTGGGDPLAGLVAAFDFRRGLQNLVATADGTSYAVRDDFGVARSPVDGACFRFNESDAASHKPYYRIGGPVDFAESVLSQPKWTLFFRGSVSARHFYLTPVSIGRAIFNRSIEPVLLTVSSHEFQTFVIGTGQFSPENATLRTTQLLKVPNNGSTCADTYCDLAFSRNGESVKFVVNELASSEVAESRHQFGRADFTDLEMFIGFTPYRQFTHNWYDFDHCIRCFGVAHMQLGVGELQRAFQSFCP